ncbi:hypothetical protein MTR67_019450 [Solanum verrucosum]|uniref:Uncharacterized protein n=1 Tax=Solanum verrucosum TaxID=315347 RepID=A0AAF0TTY9_SOLVR|nr:hypothetical protein MTR67_019450 [Solanum verrucosum]
MSIPAVPCPIYHSSFSINRKSKIFPRFFFSFIIAFLFALRLRFPRIQNLNSWSPNWL